jgi:hypothetical protein
MRPVTMDTQANPLRKRIQNAQTYDTEVSQALESVLCNGPRSITKGLEDWNLEDGLILYRGHIYIPKDKNLQKDIVKQYHETIATGHPDNGRPMNSYLENSDGQECPNLCTDTLTDAPPASPQRSTPGPESRYNQTKYP